MLYKAKIEIVLRPSILDPQGKATQHALRSLGFESVDRVRVGKLIEMWVDASSPRAAERVAADACSKLLANPVMEDFSITVEDAAIETA